MQTKKERSGSGKQKGGTAVLTADEVEFRVKSGNTGKETGQVF